MDKSTVWAFGMAFIIIVAVLAYHDFDLGIMLGKTSKTTGYVVGTRAVAVNGGYHQNKEFVYEVDGILYGGTKAGGRRDGVQHVGNRVKVKYDIKDPSKNKVIGFYPDFTRTHIEKYYITKAGGGYKEMCLVNNMILISDIVSGDIVASQEAALFVRRGDTLRLWKYLSEWDEYESVFVKQDSSGLARYRNITTGDLYTELSQY